MYMDRTYVPQNEKMPVHELGLHLWKECVVRAPRIKERLLHTLLDMIHRERSGEDVKRDLLKSITQMLTDLGRAALHISHHFPLRGGSIPRHFQTVRFGCAGTRPLG